MDKPIRILQVVTHMNRGGLETMLMNYYRHIDRNKVQFDFLVHRQERAAYDDEIESLGGKIYRLPRLVPWSKTYRRALNAFFKEHTEYKIVHVHQDCLSSVILKAAKKHGIPVRIAHSHNANQDRNLRYIIKLFYKQFIPRYATDLFACGKQAGDWMFGGAPFQILNNAIDTGLYQYDSVRAKQVRQTFEIAENTTVIGHIGRFCPQKNHNFLMDIFHAFLKIDPSAKLLLVGDGELRSAMEEKIHALGIEGSVILTGVRSDVPDLLQAMDVFLFPSLYEGLPVTLVEAQAAGLPCVISNTIPIDCDLTKQIHRVSLEKTAETWAEKVYHCKALSRSETTAQLTAAGFDIRENARWLEEFYVQRW